MDAFSWIVIIGASTFIGYLVGNPDKFFKQDSKKKIKKKFLKKVLYLILIHVRIKYNQKKRGTKNVSKRNNRSRKHCQL